MTYLFLTDFKVSNHFFQMIIQSFFSVFFFYYSLLVMFNCLKIVTIVFILL